MYCKNCGQQIADDAKFCDNCGRLTEEQPQIVQNPMQGKRPIPPGAKLCRYCQALIPRNAKVCPACHNTEKTSSATPIILAVSIIIVVIVFLAIFVPVMQGINNARSEDKIKQETPISITADELIAAYSENEVAADKIYKNKYVEVTGEIAVIDSGIDEPYIILNGGESYVSVQCFFSGSESKLAELKKGDQIIIKGIVKGESLNVIIKDCEIA